MIPQSHPPLSPLAKCPCCSGKSYSACCEIFHSGSALPATAEQLMRSRYTGYSLGLADYIIATTHPKNPNYEKNRAKWIDSIQKFCQSTRFVKLEIVEFIPGETTATVTFIAHLLQNGSNASFEEKSLFLKEGGRWLYWKADRIIAK